MALGTPTFPTTLDTAATLGPTSGIVAGTTALNAVGTNQGDQLGITNNLINTVIALETLVGITSSAVTTTLVYGANHVISVTGTLTSSSFTIPASGSTVVVAINAVTWPIQGQKIYISDGTHVMYGTITAVGSSTSITVLNTGDTGNNVSGTMATASRVELVDYQSVVWDKFTAGDNDPPSTNYATFDVINNMSTLGFVKATTTGAVFKSVLPQFAQLGSGIIVKVIWASVASITGNVTFGAAFEPTTLATFNSDHFGTQATTTTTAAGVAGVPVTTSIAIPYSTMGSAVAGNLYRLQIQRLSTDTMVGNAEVLAVTVESGVL